MRNYLYVVLATATLLVFHSSIAFGGFFDSKDAPEKKQQETLRRTCLNEAEKANGNTSLWKRMKHGTALIHDPQVDKMKQICRDMTTEYLSQDSKKHALLAQRCSDQIEEEVKKEPKNVKHFQQLQQICEQMTGQKINVKFNDSAQQQEK